MASEALNFDSLVTAIVRTHSVLAEQASKAGDIREAASPESGSLPVSLLLERLFLSHFTELLQLEAPLQRRFYEAEALRGNWSVRELKRQIASQYFQRMSEWSRPGTLPTEDAAAVSPAPTFEGGLNLATHAANLRGLGYGG